MIMTVVKKNNTYLIVTWQITDSSQSFCDLNDSEKTKLLMSRNGENVTVKNHVIIFTMHINNTCDNIRHKSSTYLPSKISCCENVKKITTPSCQDFFFSLIMQTADLLDNFHETPNFSLNFFELLQN